MSTLVSLVIEDSRCSPPSTIPHQPAPLLRLDGCAAPASVGSAPSTSSGRPLPSRPTRGQIRMLAAMVSLVVVHSTAVALYVLGG